ncbi:phospholipase C, phosphocholine-specific [Pseudomonas edaphica]|uniref:phospholipase C n=1 Tax=Pseudomonas edaphica TaxID=2006980 RepID=A0ABY2U9F9_9PSED|nr:phospholipase C, phosphocholine-specific [Pseudomonas edaphica]TLG91589.1 phospholipase C, phosphocholine-specific [Pseudomonas edaphica]
MTDAPKFHRRTFIKGTAQLTAMAGLSGLLPETIRRAMAIEPDVRKGTIEDVDHIVILMQENRSFDHYFGHLNGVRGFNDPRALKRKDGRSVMYQSDKKNDYLPFHFDTTKFSAQWSTGQHHGWSPFHGAWNRGRNDLWAEVQLPTTMGYFKRVDIPYYYALADAFTLGEAYHQSMLGPTNPNRLYHMTGRASPLANGKGVHTDNDMGDGSMASPLGPGGNTIDWMTYPERLSKKNINWRIYQEGGYRSCNVFKLGDVVRGAWDEGNRHVPIVGGIVLGAAASIANFFALPFQGSWVNYIQEDNNYDCNALAWFKNFKNLEKTPESDLWQRSMIARGIGKLREDVQNETLPSVSWIVPPFSASEHPHWGPSFGENYVARILEALTSNPKIWARTVFIVNYDEGDGFFDHVSPPIPYWDTQSGSSAVSTEGEIEDQFKQPIGLGFRVPILAISPWSRGGKVSAEVFDHTSVLQFLEKRFGVMEENISPWRRAVCGDLTSLFDFSGQRKTDVPADLTNLSQSKARQDDAYWKQYYRQSPYYIAPSSLPGQEKGQRDALAVPYQLHADVSVAASNGALILNLKNDGKALPSNPFGRSAAVFQIHSNEVGEPGFHTVTSYDIDAATNQPSTAQATRVSLTDRVKPDGRYDFEVHGPNGFFR